MIRSLWLICGGLFGCVLLLPNLLPSGPKATPIPSELRSAYARPSAQWPAPTLDRGVVHQELTPLSELAVERPPKPLVDLGKRLFFDPILSESNQISCANCHHPELGWGDGLRQSFGHNRQRGLRNAPSLLNVAAWEHFFWDGRVTSLEEQALFPLQDATEMNQSLASLPAKLNATDYPARFAQALGTDTITVAGIVEALVAFQKTIRSRKSRFDRFLAGDYAALTDQEIRGLHLFRTKARCLNCHHGALLSDQQFHNSGQHLYGRPQQDLGRYYVTKNTEDIGHFRTPSLRDVAYTGPYLHHGNILELREVLTMYNSGMPQRIPKRVRDTMTIEIVHDSSLQPLGLSEAEINDLLAFLEAVSVRPRPINFPR
ncbi:MAG: cytochrome c peroxidase [Bacteroidota bacterium]